MIGDALAENKLLPQFERDAVELHHLECPYNVYRTNYEGYEDGLGLKPGHLLKLCREKWGEGIVPSFFDLVGDPSCIRSLRENNQHACGVAVGMADLRKPAAIELDKQHGIYMIEGDILARETFEKVKVLPGFQNGFDIVVEHGVGLLSVLPKDPRVLYVLINRAYQLMNPNGSEMFMYLGTYDWSDFVKQAEIYKKYLDSLKICGIQAELSDNSERQDERYSFTLKRLPGAPLELPRMPNANPLAGK